MMDDLMDCKRSHLAKVSKISTFLIFVSEMSTAV